MLRWQREWSRYPKLWQLQQSWKRKKNASQNPNLILQKTIQNSSLNIFNHDKKSQTSHQNRDFSTIYSAHYLLRIIAELVASYPQTAYIILLKEKGLLEAIFSKLLVSQRGILAVEAQYSLSKDNQSSANVKSAGVNLF